MMFKKLATLFLTILIFNLSFVSMASAQKHDDKDAQHERDVQIFVNRFGTDNKLPVKVDLKNGSQSVKGFITQINDETFVITKRKQNTSTTVAYKDVKKIRRDTGHTYLIAALVTAGVLFGIVAICVASKRCVE